MGISQFYKLKNISRLLHIILKTLRGIGVFSPARESAIQTAGVAEEINFVPLFWKWNWLTCTVQRKTTTTNDKLEEDVT